MSLAVVGARLVKPGATQPNNTLCSATEINYRVRTNEKKERKTTGQMYNSVRASHSKGEKKNIYNKAGVVKREWRLVCYNN